jgi:hypothetical protein
MMNIARTVAQRSLIIGFGAVTGLGLAAIPAHADGLQVTPNCLTQNSHLFCTVQVSGGTAPYAIRWDGVPPASFFHEVGPEARDLCSPTTGYNLTVTVSDATHRLNGHADASGRCYAGFPGFP